MAASWHATCITQTTGVTMHMLHVFVYKSVDAHTLRGLGAHGLPVTHVGAPALESIHQLPAGMQPAPHGPDASVRMRCLACTGGPSAYMSNDVCMLPRRPEVRCHLHAKYNNPCRPELFWGCLDLHCMTCLSCRCITAGSTPYIRQLA